MVDFSGADVGDDAAFMANFGKGTGVQDAKTLKTSNSDSEDNGIAMTSYTVSDILQGVHAYKPAGLGMNAFNQLMTSQLQQVGTLNEETGANDVDIAQRLGSRKRFLPDDLMNGSFLDIVQNGGAGYADPAAAGAPLAPGDLGDVDAAGISAVNRKYTDTAGVTEQRSEPSPDGKSIMVGKYKGVEINMAAMASFKAMIDKAALDGVDLIPGTGAFRSHKEQIDLRRAHCGSSRYQIYEAPSGACSPPTARPGTSQHEWGTAIDFGRCSVGSTSHSWLSKNAATYGWINWPVESWHWSVNGH